MKSRSYRIPHYTYLGLVIIIGGQVGLRLGVGWIATWLTPIMWTGYFLTVDGINFTLRGVSWLTTRRREVPLLLLLSVGTWLVFEAYNFHLRNWYYAGLPVQAWKRDLGFFWSFATIMPGVFTTAELITGLHDRTFPPAPHTNTKPAISGSLWIWTLIGLVLIILPLCLPAPTAAYLFGAVWIGFIFLLEPFNARLGLESSSMEIQQGRLRRVAHFLIGGLTCGLLWETWNQQALVHQGAYWVYTIPEQLRIFGWHFGQMPVLGLLGFPPFALELRAMYTLLRQMLGGQRVFG